LSVSNFRMTTNRSRSSPSEVLTQSFSRMPPINSVVGRSETRMKLRRYPFLPCSGLCYVAQEIIEETLLKGECFIAVERFPLLPALREQPFFSRGYPFESFDSIRECAIHDRTSSHRPGLALRCLRGSAVLTTSRYHPADGAPFRSENPLRAEIGDCAHA